MTTTIDQSQKEQLGWDEQFKKLLAYKEEYGHFHVPKLYKDKTLVKWIVAQRNNKEQGKLSQDQIAALEKSGFRWKVFQTDWDRQYDKLLTYLKQHGNCRVPQKHPDRELVDWINKQRLLKSRNDGLNADQIRKLNSIKFEWHVLDSVWKTQPEKLVLNRKVQAAMLAGDRIPSG